MEKGDSVPRVTLVLGCDTASRDVLYEAWSEGDCTEDYRIVLWSLGDQLWWTKFTGTDLFGVNESCLKSSIDAGDLCYALGAAEDEDISRFRIKTGWYSLCTTMAAPSSPYQSRRCGEREATGCCPLLLL